MLEFDDMIGEFSPSRELSMFGTNDAFLVPSAVAESPFLYEAEKSAAGNFNFVVNGNSEQQQIFGLDIFSQLHEEKKEEEEFSNDKLFNAFAADANLSAGTGSSFFDETQGGLNDELTWLCDSLELGAIGAGIYDVEELNEISRPSSSAGSPKMAELIQVATPKSSMDIFEEIVRESEAFSPSNTSRMEEMEDENEIRMGEIGDEVDFPMEEFFSPAESPGNDHQAYLPQFLVQATGSAGENFMIAIPANMQIPVTEGTIIQFISTANENFGAANRKLKKIEPAVESKKIEAPVAEDNPTRGKIKYWNAKERKKAQNREAAQRYRQKKKGEKETRMTELERLEHRNRQLKLKINDLDREVGYFKSLINDIQTAAGKF